MESLRGQCISKRSWRVQTKTYVILVVIIIISGWTLLVKTNVTDRDTKQLDDLGLLEPAVTVLDPNTTYLSYLPHAGHANQFMSLQSAGLLAKRLNRTLIIPPIVSNTHDHNNTHQRWSRYFDLRRFSNLTGVSIVEWDQVRPLTPVQRKAGQDQATFGAHSVLLETNEWAKIAENLTCQIVFGYGTSRQGINYSSWNFLWHFLFRPVFKEPPPPVPGMPDLSLAKIKGDPEAGHDLVAVDDIVARYKNNNEQILMLSDTFKVIDPGHPGRGGSRFWNEIGSNLHFIPQLADFTTSILDKEFQYDQGIEVSPNDDPEEVSPEDSTNKNPITAKPGDLSNAAILNITAPATRIPYIAVHLRRGDIGSKCSEDNMYSRCLFPMELYVDAVARARTDAAARGLHSRLPVVVTTDTTSEDDIQKIEQLGWHRIVHAKYGTTELWGAFGAVMVDFAILAFADEFVGSPVSTMTQVTAQRRTSWYQRDAYYPDTLWDSTSILAMKQATESTAATQPMTIIPITFYLLEPTVSLLLLSTRKNRRIGLIGLQAAGFIAQETEWDPDHPTTSNIHRDIETTRINRYSSAIPTVSWIHTLVLDSGARLELRGNAALIVNEEMEKNQGIDVLPNNYLEEEKDDGGSIESVKPGNLVISKIATLKLHESLSRRYCGYVT